MQLLTLDFCSFSNTMPSLADEDQIREAAEVILSIVAEEAALLADEEQDGYGRVFLGGTESNIQEAARAVEHALKAVKGRTNQGAAASSL